MDLQLALRTLHVPDDHPDWEATLLSQLANFDPLAPSQVGKRAGGVLFPGPEEDIR